MSECLAGAAIMRVQPQPAATLLDGPLRAALESASAPDIEARLARRYDKFRDMGRLGADFTDNESA